MATVSENDLLTQLRWRYATKEFDPSATIPADTWDTIEQSLVLTPSSFGLQPWKFLVLTNPGKKSELLEHSWNQRQVVDCSHFVVIAAPTKVGDQEIQSWIDCIATTRNVSPESLAGYQQIMEGFLGNLDDAARLAWAHRQIYIALGQLMTTAALLGVDACPMEGFAPPEYDRLLQLSERNLTASVACALGYRSSDDKYASVPKARFERQAVIEHLP
ncbi:MAG: NAD(P)H-dependent oxidoreductase [Akkermansiaceae bacterium]|jgi:nitroreductase|nr:NAD(P)H-dependent oxidoreductase [Akkermansiaceae bacterium]